MTLDVDDVVQETYAVMGGLASVVHIRSPRAYVFQVAQSILLAQHRRQCVVPIEYLADLDTWDPPSDGPTPEREVGARHELNQALALVAELPARQRKAFMLLKIDGLSQREAASAMGVSESTIEKHVAKALLFLMRRLERGGLSQVRASVVRANDETDQCEARERHQRD